MRITIACYLPQTNKASTLKKYPGIKEVYFVKVKTTNIHECKNNCMTLAVLSTERGGLNAPGDCLSQFGPMIECHSAQVTQSAKLQ